MEIHWTHIKEEKLRHLKNCAILDPWRETRKGKTKAGSRGEGQLRGRKKLCRVVLLERRRKIDSVGELLKEALCNQCTNRTGDDDDGGGSGGGGDGDGDGDN